MPSFRGEAKVGQVQCLNHFDLLAETKEVARGFPVGIQESYTRSQDTA
jgi:hypothetical protein